MKRLLAFSVAAAVLAGMSGCDRQTWPEPTVPTLPEVTVDQPVRMDVQDHADYTGWTKAARKVSIRAPVMGVLISTESYADGEVAAFEEGSVVEEGRLLFVLGQAPC